MRNQRGRVADMARGETVGMAERPRRAKVREKIAMMASAAIGTTSGDIKRTGARIAMMTLRMRIQDRLTLTALKATANQTTPTQTLSNHRRRRGGDATTGMVVRRTLERDSIGEGDLPRSKRNQVLMTSQSILNSNRCSSSHLCSNQSQRLSRHPRKTSARR